MRRTHEQFVEEVSLKNPKIEVLGKFEIVDKKIQVRCKECGNVWKARASHLLEGQGCPVCANANSRKSQAKTQEQFVAEMHEKHPTIEVVGQYVNAFTPIEIKCSVCGNEWKAKPTNLSRGHGCPKCAINRNKDKFRKQKSHEEYVHDIQTANPDIEIISRYINSRSKVQCKCKKCGRIWTTRADMVLVRGCPDCDNERIVKLKKTHEEFCDELKKVNPNIVIIGKYKNTETKIHVKCIVCGNKWDVRPDHLLKGHGCPVCALKESGDRSKKTQEEFESEVSIFNPNIEIIGQYDGNKRKIKVRCKICNHVWMANPSHLARDRGCPRCAEFLQTSFPEQSLHYYINKIFPDSINSFNYLGKCFDIYIPSLRTVIEYDGLRWHKNIEKDIEKNKLCKENQIRIIRIREEGLPFIEGSINIERNQNHTDADLECCIRKVIEILQPDTEVNVDIARDRNTIRSLYLESEAINDKVIRQLEEIGSDWELVEYKGTQVPVKVKCKKCGYETSKSIYVLLSGDTCSRCRRESEFLQKMAKRNPNVKIVGRYERSEEKIEAVCKICGSHWFMTPHYLLKGGKCPNFRKHTI